MKKLYLPFFLSFYTFFGISQTVISGNVIRVADDDTITILDSLNKQTRIRFYGIDCLENGQDFSNVAKKFTSDLCYSKIVRIEVKDVNRYGRAVGTVFTLDSININLELLEAGLAWHYKLFDKSEKFAQTEYLARINKVGLWIQPNAVAPWE